MTKYLSVFTNKRMLVTLLLGFSGGLPLALVGSTLQAWLARSSVDIAIIGQFALVQLPYTLKFLWAPLMDNTPLPFLGLRRGWMALTQVGLFVATVAMATVNPAHGLALFSLLAFLVAFFSASQDIVIDAYRTEIIEDEKELGAGASTYITGYRIATLVSGGVALGLADQIGWRQVYILMAVINLVGLVTILLTKEPKVTRDVKKEKQKSFTQPFIEFFQRSGAMEILIFVMVYKLSTLMATALTTKFLVDLGYTNIMIGGVNKGAGLIATIVGTLAGGAVMAKMGLKKSLWFFGILQSLVGLTFCLLAHMAAAGSPSQALWLVIVVSMDNFMMGMGTAALTGFLMHICSKRYTATDYALLTSVLAVGRVVLVANAGTMVAHMGYDLFFISTVPLAIPGLLLLRRYDHWEESSGKVITTKLPTMDLSMMGIMIFSLILLSSDPIWRFLDKPELGTNMVLAGALGVLLVVVIGLVRPKPAKR